jgi:hypothetical protein
MWVVFEEYMISSLTGLEALLEEQFQVLDIGIVVSLGCKPSNIPPTVVHIYFPNIRDECDEYLVKFWISLFSELNNIKKSTTRKVLIHCVYGQSRSAATILALHLLSSKDSLQNAFHQLKIVKSDISINPSFIYQLQFLNSLTISSVETSNLEDVSLKSIFKSLNTQYQFHENNFELSDIAPSICENSADSYLQKIILCKSCKGFLASDLDVIHLIPCYSDTVMSYLDEFWLEWMRCNDRIAKPSHQPSMDGNIFVSPLPWIINQLNMAKRNGSTSEQICCPHCSMVVGSWVAKSLNFICPFLPVDCFALCRRSIYQQRKCK